MRRPPAFVRSLAIILAYMFVMSAFEAIPSATARGGLGDAAVVTALRVPAA